MVKTQEQLRRAIGALLVCVFAYGVMAQSVPEVPTDWNKDPVTDGAYLEDFESKPAWVDGDSDVTDQDVPAMNGAPVRANTWFGPGAKVLKLETDGEFISNELKGEGDSDVSFADRPVYVDLKVYFGAFDGAPTAETLNDAKLAIYAAAGETAPAGDLKIVHADGTADGGPIDLETWYQVTVKLEDGKFDVLLDDAVVASGLAAIDNDADNKLQSVDFYGTSGTSVPGGFIDNLYVGYGNPARLLTGPVPSLDSFEMSAEEKERMLVFLGNQAGMNAASGGYDSRLTVADLGASYLLNDVTVVDGEVVPPSYSFGISKIEVVSATEISVTAKLDVNDSGKDGAINGKIQLVGKQTSEGEYAALSEAITPEFAEFTDGEATYNFEIEAGYKYFKALIVE